MLPVRTPARRDPAPSRLGYRLNRLWLRPGVRRAVNFGVPMLAGVLAASTFMAHYDLRGHVVVGDLACRIVKDAGAAQGRRGEKAGADGADDAADAVHAEHVERVIVAKRVLDRRAEQ